jgi:hypothetical protein
MRFRTAAVSMSVVGLWLGTVLPGAALEPCQSNCSRIEVGSAQVAAGGVVSIPVSFTQGPNDGSSGGGNDEIAALALTLGIPGAGADAPLVLADCADSDGDGLPDAVTPSAAIASGFRLVVENAACTNRTRCLCPGDGQTRDNFVNLVVYGPKDLPEQGSVEIPVLPSGELAQIRLRAGADLANDTVVPLHIFAETDDPGMNPKPEFGALFSQGDKSAVDQTADRQAGVSKVQVGNGSVTVMGGGTVCVGDCNGDGNVFVNELILGVNIALGSANLSECAAFDENKDGEVTISELIKAVNNALNGCPS